MNLQAESIKDPGISQGYSPSLNNKKIAFLGNQIAWGGGAKSLLLLLKSLSGTEAKFYLFATRCQSEEMKQEFEKYVEFVKIFPLPELVSAQTQSVQSNSADIDENEFNMENVQTFTGMLRELSIDILHINNSVFTPIYKNIKNNSNVKIVTHVREWIHWNEVHEKQKFIIDNILTYSDGIICISNTESEVFQGHKNLHIIPNPFDFEELNAMDNNTDAVKKKNGINLNSAVVGMMSSFQKNKGPLLFFKSLNHIKKHMDQESKVTFVMLGQDKPSILNRLKARMIKFLGRESYFCFEYIKTVENKQNDITVRPSLTNDPWGRDIIEYMAMKKPVIATGTSEFFIKDELTGYLIESNNYILLAEKIHYLLRNEKKRKQIGQAAFDAISAQCKINFFRKKLLAVYSSI